ncbi:MAG: acetate/propionate family kinase [Thermomicrobiales bacterium]
MSEQRLLTINTGSSSLKATLYTYPSLALGATARAERIGQPGSRLNVRLASDDDSEERAGELPDHATAMRALLDWLRERGLAQQLAAVGHRIVHGGAEYRDPQGVTPALVAALHALVPIDPDHLPQALAAIAATSAAYSDIPQFACFDTAFHRTMPPVAQRYALPHRFAEDGVLRYGFHGLSYESILDQLRDVDPNTVTGRLIIAHLGNGASMVAVLNGASVETTMGFTPTGGLVMGTRTGDLDPGVLLYLLQHEGLDAAAVSELVNRQAGLLAVSETSSDMRDLLERAARDPRAALAVALFCYQAKKYLGALAAVLGGLDTLVFTGGIGEHAAPVRAEICAGLGFLGIELDRGRNTVHAPIISADGSAVTVRVIPTDEDRVIARHTTRLLARQGEQA